MGAYGHGANVNNFDFKSAPLWGGGQLPQSEEVRFQTRLTPLGEVNFRQCRKSPDTVTAWCPNVAIGVLKRRMAHFWISNPKGGSRFVIPFEMP